MKKSLLSVVAAAAILVAGCATQGTTDNGSGTSASTMSTSGNNSCKGVSSCKGMSSCKGKVVSKTTVSKTTETKTAG